MNKRIGNIIIGVLVFVIVALIAFCAYLVIRSTMSVVSCQYAEILTPGGEFIDGHVDYWAFDVNSDRRMMQITIDGVNYYVSTENVMLTDKEVEDMIYE